MKVLVIGGGGNLGKEYCKYLKLRDIFPVVFDLPQDINSIQAKEIVDLSPDFVINFSMIADLTSKYLSGASKDYQVNVKGIENLINKISDAKIPLIQISTREVIGLRDFRRDQKKPFVDSNDLRKISEDEPCLPLHSYGKTKLVAEYLCQGYDRGTVVRLNTPFTDDWKSGKGLISVLVKKSCEDGKVRLDNLGQAVRDPLHVSDLTDLTLKIYEQGVYQEVINAAGDDKNIISLREICTTVNPSVVIDAGTNNSDYGFLMDIRKAVDLGWEPQVDIRTWLQRVGKD